ncbi:hypothetical protein Q7A53_03615 [Halobacillus rhizosphaerae]|uniref:hypothetical protein n=1 Tax=Halobacillus rhizosphaerae TaxID=3064889 RepID=UPI00398A9B79
MRHVDQKKQTQSFQLLTNVYLVKKSREAYEQARSMVENGHPHADKLCKERASTCYSCAERIQETEDMVSKRMKEICRLNGHLCIELIQVLESKPD